MGKSKAWSNDGMVILRSPFLLQNVCMQVALKIFTQTGTRGMTDFLIMNDRMIRKSNQ